MFENLLPALNSIEYNNIIGDYVIKGLADVVIKKATKTFLALTKGKEKEYEEDLHFDLPEKVVLTRIEYIINFGKSWCQTVNFRDLQNPKNVNEIFVDQNFYLTPIRFHIDKGLEPQITAEELFSSFDYNKVILGPPGAGKTTLVKHLCVEMFSGNRNSLLERFSFPVVIRLKDFSILVDNSKSRGLYSILSQYFGIEFLVTNENMKGESSETFNRTITEGYKYNLAKQMIMSFVDDLNVLLILDGFDEIPQNINRSVLIAELEELSISLTKSKFILTCRSADFNCSIEKTNTYEISPLTSHQIKTFIDRWLVDKSKADHLYELILSSPFNDTTIRPLNLAHLCALYERNGYIPDQPKSVYEKIVYLLIEDWTIQQRVERRSSFVTFTADRRVDFLSRIAFLLTTLYKASVFSKKELQACYFDIYKDFNLKEKDFDAVIIEIESHNGLILQTSFNSLEFAHKSLQEFLTANYINKVSITNLNKSQILRLPNELAIAVALSLNPNVDLSFYVLSVLKSSVIQEDFFFSFIARLQLEKPNFTRNPILAVAISFIYEQLIVNSHLTYFEKMINKLLNLLSIHENIRKCFEELPAYYRDESGFKKFLLPDSEIKFETLIGPFTLVATKQFQELKSLRDTPQTIFVNHTMLKWYFNIDEGIKK